MAISIGVLLEELRKHNDPLVENIKILLRETFEDEGLGDYDQEIEFLARTVVHSYRDGFDNDIVVKTDREFGFNSIKQIVESIHSVESRATTREQEVSRVSSNLLSRLRDIELSEYLENDYLQDDIETVGSLLFHEEDSVSKLEEQIEQNQAIQSSVERTVTSIISVYEQVMAGGFEIEPYFGVSTLMRNVGTIKVDNGKAKVYKSVALKGLADILSKQYRVSVSSERQFNMEEILTSDKPVYFPFKIVEYVFGRVSTKNIKSGDYSRFDGGSGWEAYASSYVKPNLKHFLNRGIKHYVETNGLVEDGDLAFEDEFRDIQGIKQALKKMERSMVTMAIVPELESTSANYENWSSIKLRLVDVTESLPTNQKLIGLIIRDLMDGLGSSSGQEYKVASEMIEDLASYKVYEYEHIFDSKMANIRPLFAYQALDALQSKGETVDWSNIILGKGSSGRTITSKEGSSINLSSQLIHNIIAGSRSGKGVMTLNILSTAIASERPVFYLDRKPDMAALFAEYVGLQNNTPNMFIANGSAYEGRFDPSGVLNYDNMQEKWRSRVPEWWDATSYKDIGDVVYYRGILFTLGILLLRFWAETADRGLYNKLGGDNGVAIVFDEFTNWQNAFSAKRMNPRGANSLFGKDMLLNKKDLSEIEKALDEIDELGEEGHLGSRQKSTLRNANNVLNTLRSEKRAYASDLLDNLDRTLMTLDEKKNAGFKNTEEKRSDIFVIGQNVEIKPLPEGITFSRNQASGGLNADRSYENTCAVSNFLYNFSTDWFMGYNRDYPHYMLANEQSSPSYSKLTGEARNFVYYEGSRDAVMGSVKPSTLRSNAKYFKPYLILNNAKEPKPLSNDPEERKAQCQQAEFQYVGGVILNTGKEWDKIRQQNLQEGTDELRQEIGFFDYLGQLGRGAGSTSDPKETLAKSKEIADMIVRQMGYDGDYLDFLMDLRPEWNFSAQDIVDAFATPDVFQSGSKRMPTYLKLFGNTKEKESDDGEDLDLGFVGVEDESYEDVEIGDELEDSDYEELDLSHIEDDLDEDAESDNDFSGTDYYKGEELGTSSSDNIESTPLSAPTGVVDPFATPVPTVAPVVPVGGVDQGISSMSTEDLLRELESRGVPSNELQGNYDKEVYGSENSMELFNEVVQTGNTGGVATSIAPMNQNIVNENEFYTNYFEFCEKVTEDILNSFGGYDGIEVLVVKDGMLYINNIKYNKRYTEQQLKGLPIDKKHQILNNNFAHIFNFAHLTKMNRLAYLSFDSHDFAFIKVRQDLKQGFDFDVMTIFKAVKSLFYLSIRGKRYQRDTVEHDIAKNSSVFKSAKKRQMIANSAEEWGTNSVNNSWDSTKNMYQRKGWGWKVGGTAMLGVTAVAGAGVLGFKGLKELRRGVKELFKDN